MTIVPSISMQYDSNVTLQPDQLPAATKVANKEDYRTVFHLVGEYQFFQNDCWSSVGRYTYYESVHASLHDFDLIQNQVNYALARKVSLGGTTSIVGFDVDYSNSLLHARRYLDALHFRTTWGLNVNQNNFIQWQWRIQNHDFHYTIFSPHSNQDGLNNLVGFNYFLFHGRNTRYLRCGFLYDHDSTIGSDWDYDGYRFLLGYYLPLGKGFNFNLDGEYYYQDYKNVDSFYNRERSDREYTWSVALNRDFLSNLNAALLYLGRQHNSNIKFYEYDRHVVMFTLSAHF